MKAQYTTVELVEAIDRLGPPWTTWFDTYREQEKLSSRGAAMFTLARYRQSEGLSPAEKKQADEWFDDACRASPW